MVDRSRRPPARMARGCRRVAPNRREIRMRFSGRLVAAALVVAMAGLAYADPPLDPAVEARIKALEERVAQLENRLTAVTNAQKAAATASATPVPGVPAAAPQQGSVHMTPAVPSSVALARWKRSGDVEAAQDRHELEPGQRGARSARRPRRPACSATSGSIRTRAAVASCSTATVVSTAGARRAAAATDERH